MTAQHQTAQDATEPLQHPPALVESQELAAPLQRPPALAGSSTTLISLFLGLPIVSVAIFGTGLWLGHQWYRSSSLVSPMQPDVFSARHTVVAALQQHAPASSLKTTSPRHPAPTSRDAEATTKPAPKPPFEDMARSPGLPNDLWSAQFESDAEGWRVVKDSQTPEDIVDFIATFPTSRFVGAARARLRQLQAQSSISSPDDLGQPVHPSIVDTQQAPSPDSASVTSLQVRYAQVGLRLAGFDPGPVDGIFGQRTLVALRQYQASRDLPMTGTFDTATQQALQLPSHLVLSAWQQVNRTTLAMPVTSVQTNPYNQQVQPRHNAGAFRQDAQMDF